MPYMKPINVERAYRQSKCYQNYLGNKWLYIKETYGLADQLDYLDFSDEIDETFPTMDVIRKGRNLFIDQ